MMICPADPTIRLNLAQEGIRLLRFGSLRWQFVPADNTASWFIRVFHGGWSHSEVLAVDRRGRLRSMFIPKGDAWKYSLALARQLNGNVHIPCVRPLNHGTSRTHPDAEI